MRFKLVEVINNFELYDGYHIVFKNNGQATILDKDQNVIMSDLTYEQAKEKIKSLSLRNNSKVTGQYREENQELFTAIAVLKHGDGRKDVSVSASSAKEAENKLKAMYPDFNIRMIKKKCDLD